MICTHTFIRIDDATKPRPGSVASMHATIGGAVVGCVNCGQVRVVWSDGKVELAHEGGKPIEEDAV